MANKLELTWYGKENKVVVEPRLLLEDKQLSNCPEGEACNNMLIHGDNLLVLKALEKSGYIGKIKCIYIDPPYAALSPTEQGKSASATGALAPDRRQSAERGCAARQDLRRPDRRSEHTSAGRSPACSPFCDMQDRCTK